MILQSEQRAFDLLLRVATAPDAASMAAAGNAVIARIQEIDDLIEALTREREILSTAPDLTGTIDEN